MNTEICPLCGRPNQCGMAAGNATCWCSAVTIPAEVIDRIPSDQRNQTCVCPACAKGAEPGADRPDGGHERGWRDGLVEDTEGTRVDGVTEGTGMNGLTEETEGTETPD